MEVPGYTEIRELGHGGTGRVMLAVRDSDGLSVAIKHLSEPLLRDEQFVERFRAEADLIREIDSPHTARVLDYVESPDDAVIVMELVDGVTLRRLLEHEGGTGAEAALAVLKGALLGLAEAHRRGVVHRDFKPENVLITQDGESKLVDFGVAARFGERAALVGTPSYMAPEQWDDAPASPATDVYAATLVFFECLTGHRAFHGENVAALAYLHQHAVPPLADVEEPLRPLVQHGLAKDPTARPESADAFLAELEDVAVATYGEDWESRGRTGLGMLAVPLAALLPNAHPAVSGDAATSMFHSGLTPVTKFAVTGGLVLATAAAVVSTFVILGGPPEPRSGAALPPATTAPPATADPATPTTEPPTPRESLSGTPPITLSGDPTVYPSGDPTAPPTRRPDPTTGGPRPAPPTETRDPTGEPTRPPEPTRSEEPRPSTRPPTTAPPDDPPPSSPDDDPPPTTSAPDPTTRPPGRNPEPLLSVSVGVSLDVPILGGDGDGLLDADIDVGLDSSLLGMVLVVPGSVLLGRQIVARRARRPRDAEKR
ncbi:serine/threonine-protein kinase [Nonomuraea polychroma]|uniref:non-specific serine/threonine protein kinase n=1 Tax=Nonomuraea polychroma TaxID=46176 RepID=A0A438M3T1_9ACTN|nr:serine/threonine-protein kinase [Nonomuraea polychroma]RVX40510.1 serine/threonine-protein kinase [Nonomuraea polychroma]